MSQDNAENNKINRIRFAVIGDSFDDLYEVLSRKSESYDEGLGPKFVVRSTKQCMGGAANVAANLNSLGGDVVFMLTNAPSGSRRTRYVDSVARKIVMRVDDDEKGTKHEDVLQKMPSYPVFRHIMQATNVDAIVCADYGKWIFNKELSGYVARYAEDSGIPLFVNCKKFNEVLASAATWCVVNSNEFEANLVEYSLRGRVVVTMEEKGARWLRSTSTKELDWMHVSTKPLIPENVAGAGDTFMAAFASAVMRGMDTTMAVCVANACATSAVAEMTTAIADLRVAAKYAINGDVAAELSKMEQELCIGRRAPAANVSSHIVEGMVS